MWLGKLTTLDMTPLGWLDYRTSTQTNKQGHWLLDVVSKKLLDESVNPDQMPYFVFSGLSFTILRINTVFIYCLFSYHFSGLQCCRHSGKHYWGDKPIRYCNCLWFPGAGVHVEGLFLWARGTRKLSDIRQVWRLWSAR